MHSNNIFLNIISFFIFFLLISFENYQGNYHYSTQLNRTKGRN